MLPPVPKSKFAKKINENKIGVRSKIILIAAHTPLNKNHQNLTKQNVKSKCQKLQFVPVTREFVFAKETNFLNIKTNSFYLKLTK